VRQDVVLHGVKREFEAADDCFAVWGVLANVQDVFEHGRSKVSAAETATWHQTAPAGAPWTAIADVWLSQDQEVQRLADVIR
jgi:hypothetical protein